MQFARLLPLVVALGFAVTRVPAAEFTVQRGEIAGAKFMIVAPAQWNGRVLLLAHGLRPEDQPLHAELYEDKPPASDWLARHWLVAITSYRRNGIVVQDAIADLDALRAHIVKRFGAPKQVYLMGESMGGAIVTRMMESLPADYAGAVAVGAALQVEGMEPGFTLNRQPKRPLLFLTNQSELTEPEKYCAATRTAAVPPVLWRVARDGHVNANAAEKIAALDAVVAWAESGRVPPHEFDGTIEPKATASAVVFNADGSATGHVTDVHPVYGNLTLDFSPADLKQLGIEAGSTFTLVAGEHSYPVFFGKSFDSVPRSEWVGFPGPDANYIIAINHGNAGAIAGLEKGAAVTLRPLKRP